MHVVCVYVCACMCIVTCVLGFRDTCVLLCVLHACRGLRLITGIILHCSSILFFEVGPVSQIQSSLAWPLSLASLLWVSFVTLPRLKLQAGHRDHPAFYVGSGDQTQFLTFVGQALKPQTYISNP